MKEEKINKGITLIALIITIIILLILAGVSIVMLTGSNGLLTKALKAKEEHLINGYKEELNLIIAEEVAERKTETKTEPMIESLEKKIIKEEKDWIAKVSKEKQDGETVEYLIIESKEGYEFVIEVDNEKETAKIIETNKTPGQKYTITYHPNGGIGEARTVEVRKGFKKKLEKNNFTKDDYIFTGWCEEKDVNGKKYMEESIYLANGNVTLYALWSYNVATVTFDANGGTGNMESKKVTKGETIELTENSFQREGYEFEKWNTKADGTGTDYINLGSITTENNVTLYAIWKEKTSVKSSIKNQTVFEEKTTIPDEYGNEVTIPGGFKIAEDSGTDVTKGIVIEDVTAGNETTKGSQFVWIPVGKVTNEDGTKIIELNRYTFYGNGNVTKHGTEVISSYYQELETSNYKNAKAINIEAFKTSVNANHGYYIGRYEAGDPMVKAFRDASSGVSSSIVCKENQFVYDFVTQPQASVLSRGMYSKSKESIDFTSDLMNSYAWDTSIVFIQEFSGTISYAEQGRKQTTRAKTGKSVNGTDVKCNIYDLAANCREWTTETALMEGYPCINRGVGYDHSSMTARVRRSEPATDHDQCSFRPVIYFDVKK